MIINEFDDDLEVTRISKSYRPAETIAKEEETARFVYSQRLVDETLEREQREFDPDVKTQAVPGEGSLSDDIIEGAILYVPEKMVNPVLNPPIDRTTVSRRLKIRMGMPNIRALTSSVVPRSGGAERIRKYGENAFGLSTQEKTVKNTPVSRLNFIDQFFNWLNAFLS